MCELQKMSAQVLFSIQRLKTSTAVESYCEREIANAEDRENTIHCNLDSWVQLVQILCTYGIFSILVLKLLHYI